MTNENKQGYQKTKWGWIPEDWKLMSINEITDRIKNPVDVQSEEKYQQIGIRSHGKGIFHKEKVTGESLGNKRVFWIEPDCFVVNIVFAWEQAVAKTTEREVGMIASHRFPMYKPKEDILDLDYLLYFFKTPLGKHLLGLASPGGAGRNKTLGQKEFGKLKIPIPPLEKQIIIIQILKNSDSLIYQLQQLIDNKNKRKKGLIQYLLSDKYILEVKKDKVKKIELGKLCSITTGKLDANAMNENGIYRFYTCAKQYYKINTYAFDTEALLISGNGANVGYIHYYEGKFNAYQRTYVLNNFSENILYLKFYLELFLKARIKSTVNKGNTPYIRLSTLTEMNIKIPSKGIQKSISEILSNAEIEISFLDKKLDNLKKQKKGLMQQLLTGKTQINILS